MNRTQAIFQEIENKLVKDDYASTLPTYHPAKGRRKKGLKDLERVNLTQGHFIKGTGSNDPSPTSQDPIPTPDEKDLPDSSPEIEDPDGEEFNPERDFPGRDIHFPHEEEIPRQEPGPEIDSPDQEEFGRQKSN